MKHLDVIDGEIAAVPLDQRPSPSFSVQRLHGFRQIVYHTV